MKPVIYSLFGEHPWLASLLQKMNAEKGTFVLRDFPDGETYFQFQGEVADREIIFLASLDYPNAKIMPLLFAAATAKELGAKKVSLIAPYLAYMRQDKRFHPGEAITSNEFARLFSQYFDSLVTVDPHLHRHHHLNEIYSIPSIVIPAAPAISAWIQKNIPKPILIGPDMESEQWVSQVASAVNIPFVILEKTRVGDASVSVSDLKISDDVDRTPILVDDIISTGRTMMVTITKLKQYFLPQTVCIGVHAVFAGDAYQQLLNTGARVVTCNTIAHLSNGIDVAPFHRQRGY